MRRCADREHSFDIINIRFQLFHCELSYRVAALTDFLVLMQSYPSLPPQPFPPEVHQLSAHYSPLICLLLHSFTFLPSFLLILWFPLFPLHFPIIITSVIALPLPSGGVFTSASPSNPPFLDYYRMITATIPS